MRKNVYFFSGIFLAVIGAIGFWALKGEQRAIEPIKKKEGKTVSLLTINFIPTSPVKPVNDSTFWEAEPESVSEPQEKNLKELQGKPVILHFWATWCGPCIQELPALNAFSEAHKKEFHVRAVTTDLKDVSKIQNFYKGKGITDLIIAFDRNNYLARSFHVSNLPTTLFINSK